MIDEFGSPHTFVEAQIKQFSKYPRLSMQNSASNLRVSQVANSFFFVNFGLDFSSLFGLST